LMIRTASARASRIRTTMMMVTVDRMVMVVLLWGCGSNGHPRRLPGNIWLKGSSAERG
jgi:hypothetical protein